jgi:DNA-binding transcriptional regulator of glucitol operon
MAAIPFMYGLRRFLYWTVAPSPHQHEGASGGLMGERRDEGAGMGVGWLFLLLGVLWLLQLVLAYQQAQRFMARARRLRRLGRVAIGASRRQLKGRAYVVVAVGPDDRLTAAEALRGITVFANARPVPALVGLPAGELAAGAPVPGLAPRVLAAAHAAAAVLHPDRAGEPRATGRRPQRRWPPRGGMATS